MLDVLVLTHQITRVFLHLLAMLDLSLGQLQVREGILKGHLADVQVL